MSLLAGRRALGVVIASFLANGIGVGMVGGLLPSFTAHWNTDASHIGALLVTFGFAAIIGITVGGRLSDSHGARLPLVIGLAGMALGVLGLGWSPALAPAFVIGLVYGFGNGMLDCAMNAMAVQVEAVRPRPVMSRFHATWSLGSLSGAAVVLLLGQLTGSTATVLRVTGTLAALALALTAIVVSRAGIDTERVSHDVDGGKRAPIPREAWLLGGMAICFGIAEGTATDWSSVHVERVGDLSPSAGALGLVAVATFMVSVRFAGDAIVHRMGRRAVVRWGAALAACGYVVTATQHSLAVVLIGWCVVGAGVALVAPQIYGLAGIFGSGRGLSVVVAMGYSAFLVGPGIMGALVHRVGVQHAMFWPLALALMLSALSFIMPTERDAATGADAPAQVAGAGWKNAGHE